MKKITFFMSLLFGLIAGNSWAQSFKTSTVDDYAAALSNGAVYLIKGAGTGSGNNSDRYVAYNSTTSSTYVIQTQTPFSTGTCGTFQIVASGTSGKYYIYCVGAGYVTCSDATSGTSKLTMSTTTSDAALWYIVNSGDSDDGIIDIVPCSVADDVSSVTSSSLSWNIYGGTGNTNMGLYGRSDRNSAWSLIPYLPTGYYYMKTVATNRPQYLYNDVSNTDNTENVTLQNSTSVTTNNGVWHITHDGTSTLGILNGQGTPLKAKGNNSDRSTYYEYSELTLESAYTGTGYYFTEGLNATDGWYSDYKVGDTYCLSRWTDGGSSKSENQWLFEEVDGTAYTVGESQGLLLGETGGAKRTSTNELAYDGGFFISTETLTADDFTSIDVEGYSGSVVLDGNTITVTYTPASSAICYVALQNMIPTAQTVLNTRGVGYPTTTSDAYTTLSNAIAAAQVYTSENATADAITTLENAVSAYKSATTGIQMPEDGKAYVFTNVHPGGSDTNRYINYTEDGLALVERGTTEANDLPMSAKFICRVVGSTYVFANNAGKYLIWRGSNNGYNDNKGYVDSFDETYCPMTFVRMTTSSYTGSASSNEDFFGMVAFGGKRKSGANSYFITNSGLSFNQDGGWTIRYNTSHSTAFKVEEVDYPNNVTLNSTEGMNDETMSNNGVNYIGTFSAPFPTVIPEGVSAYYVSEAAEGVATVTALSGEAIPANTGVLLTSSSATSALMVPATDETTATISGTNLLGNSAGADLTIAEGNTTKYVLTKVGDKIAFYLSAAGTLTMNKAYLDLSSASSAPQFTLNFGGTSTGIEAVSTNDDAAPVIYDLSGRRVKNATKGLYIVNGKKVCVK